MNVTVSHCSRPPPAGFSGLVGRRNLESPWLGKTPALYHLPLEMSTFLLPGRIAGQCPVEALADGVVVAVDLGTRVYGGYELLLNCNLVVPNVFKHIWSGSSCP